jgi:molybdopterin synthase sulfur carrier subunit
LQISVRFFTVIREITGKKEETLQFSNADKITVYTVLRSLEDRYGKAFGGYVFLETGEVKAFLQFFINGQSAAALDGLDSELQSGDVLAIVPPVGGG